MARGNASSSDKLLEMIRGKKKGQQDTETAAQAAVPPPAPGASGKKDKVQAKKGSAPGKKSPASKASKTPKAKKVKIGSSGFSANKGGGKAVVVGVDLGSNSMHLAKSTGPANKRKLLGFKHVPYDPGTPPGSAGFVNFLREKLRDFTRGHRKYEVWSNISSAKAELWNINIPKVPRKQIMDAVYWSVKKEKPFDESDYILDFDVLGEVAEKGVPKLAVTVYLAPKKQVDELSELFSKAGFKLHGVIIAPIAIQTLFRSKWMETSAKTYANLYVGRNWSRIDIFNKGNLVLSRGIKAGTNSMLESLMESYNLEHSGAPEGGETILQDEPVISMDMDDDEDALVLEDIPSQTMDGTSPSGTGQMELEHAKQLLGGRLLGGKVPQGIPGSELSEEEVVELILPAAERLVRQIERTFEFHSTTMGNEPVEQIYFSGSVCTNKLVLQYMYSQLGIESLVLDPLNPDNPNIGQMPTPDTAVERSDYNLVVALALSDNSITPNLLYTFKDKERERQAAGVDKAIYVVTIFVLGLLAGVWMWQRAGIEDARDEFTMLQSQLNAYQPPADGALLLEMADKVSKMHLALKKASRRYEGLTLLSELSGITPNYVRLLSVEMNLGAYVEATAAGESTDKKKPAAKSPEQNKSIILDGFVDGNDVQVDKFESAFTRYLIRLENSPLFGTPKTNEEATKKEDFAKRGVVYRFIISVPVE